MQYGKKYPGMTQEHLDNFFIQMFNIYFNFQNPIRQLIKSLIIMKKPINFLLAMGLVAAIAALSGCKKDPVIPDLKTASVSEITTVSAVSAVKLSPMVVQK